MSTLQITELLTDRAGRLADLLADPTLRADLEMRAAAAADQIASALASEDASVAATVAADLYVLAHGDSDPDPEWWQTPLGRAIARVDHDSAEAVMPSTAARMLGIGVQRVYQLRADGKLDRHPDGGVTRASVMARLARSTTA